VTVANGIKMLKRIVASDRNPEANGSSCGFPPPYDFAVYKAMTSVDPCRQGEVEQAMAKFGYAVQ
jgi:hypothetical protein